MIWVLIIGYVQVVFECIKHDLYVFLNPTCHKIFSLKGEKKKSM